LDFGGVLAEEGFREGLQELARSAGLSEQQFFAVAAETAFESGFVTGAITEPAYWELVRQRTGINGSDSEFRQTILKRFVLRPWMLETVRALRAKGYLVAILSDQTGWLDELDARDGFFQEFDAVFNSYHLGKSKRDPEVFVEVAETLGLPPANMLFVDDNPENVARARGQGLHGIHYQDRERFLQQLEEWCSSAGEGNS